MEVISNEEYIQTYGPIIDNIDIKISSFISPFNCIFLLRKLAYAVILVVFYYNPVLQRTVTLFCLVFPVKIQLIIDALCFNNIQTIQWDYT